MAYYDVECIEVPEPPVPLVGDAPADVRKEDAPAWKRDAEHRHKVLVDERKVRVDKQAALTKEVGEYAYVVKHVATGKVVCVCQGPAQANYIAGLMNDRPHM